eukprot:3156675-Rhodomonas_salina.1
MRCPVLAYGRAMRRPVLTRVCWYQIARGVAVEEKQQVGSPLTCYALAMQCPVLPYPAHATRLLCDVRY